MTKTEFFQFMNTVSRPWRVEIKEVTPNISGSSYTECRVFRITEQLAYGSTQLLDTVEGMFDKCARQIRKRGEVIYENT